MLAAISYPPIPIFEVGPLSLSLHGLFAALGFLAGAALVVRLADKRGFDTQAYQSILTWALVGAILGARLLTVPAHISEYESFFDVIRPAGSYSIMGGYLGGILAGALRARLLRVRWWVMTDTAPFGLALGAVVGRIGDLALVEHLGNETSFFLGYGLKPGYEPAPQHTILQQACDTSGTPAGEICAVYHHTALYDMIGALVLLGFLFWLANRWGRRRYGQLFGVWVAWYGLQRFLIDFARLVPEGVGSRAADATLGPLTWSQWSGLAASFLGVGLVLWFGSRGEEVGEAADRALGGRRG